MPEIEARDGVKLYAETHGDGMPVLLSCGMCTTHKNFYPQIEALTAAGEQDEAARCVAAGLKRVAEMLAAAGKEGGGGGGAARVPSRLFC